VTSAGDGRPPVVVRRGGTVAVIGAGQCGRATAQRLAESDVFDTVVLTDIVEGRAEGLAMDINQSRPILGFETSVVGRSAGRSATEYAVIAHADVVVIAAGVAPAPAMTWSDTVRRNGPIVRVASAAVARYAPEAVVAVLSNPVEDMTALARAATGFPAHRVVGQSVLLDTARLVDFVAAKLAVARSTVEALVVGSHAHDGGMVPLLSLSTAGGQPITSLLDGEELADVVVGIRRGGADVARLLGTGSSFYAPSAATARLVLALRSEADVTVPVCAFVDGEYGIHDVYIGVPAVLGRGGVRRILELPVTEAEEGQLRVAAGTLRNHQREALRLVLSR
jgi:malate dehydrogenase